jgi:PAS domain-containing protein
MPRLASLRGLRRPPIPANYRAIFDGIPSPVFLVDDDICIRDANRAAEEFFSLDSGSYKKNRGGEVLHCLNLQDVKGATCGSTKHCAQCVIRNSVRKCLVGDGVTRQRMKLKIVQTGQLRQLDMLITANRIEHDGEDLTLLILEDITELTMLKDIIPICLKCKKIRDDDKFWKNVESYFHELMGVDFSHGMCPTCAHDLYPEYFKPVE